MRRRHLLYILALLLPLIACTKEVTIENKPWPDPEPGMEGIVEDFFLCLILEDEGQPLTTAKLQVELYTENQGE
ncbi:MAG: hypothetical protein CSA97_00355 [Bacteroidetes bacterium]|nr:MAG: hypothetical protein CSA97_00355 [Bacteroidota bacterium]